MPIYVCVKHVPDTGAVISLDGKNTYKEKGVKFVMNPYDEFAVEEALQWADKMKEDLVAVTFGKVDATSTLHAALALGAVRAIHVTTESQYVSPALAAKALAAAISEDGTPKAVFTGKQSVDAEGMQFPYLLAQELNLPLANEVIELVLDGETVSATRELGGGVKEKLCFSCPCLIGATKGLNTPRYPKLPDIMKAKKKPITLIPAETFLGPNVHSRRVLDELTLMSERTAGARAHILEGTVGEQAAELRRIIKEKTGI